MKSRKRLFSPSLGLLSAMLADAGLACNTSTRRDFETLKSRIEHEGGSFVTICLPTFAKGFERSIEAGRWLPNHFTGFKTRKGTCLPAFLQGFTSLVFDSKKGVIHEDPSPDAVMAVRQICLAHNKLKAECTEARQRTAALAYVSCEAEVSEFRVKNWPLRESFREVADSYYGGILSELARVLRSSHGLPTRHGPGVTVGGTSGNQKYNSRQWSRRLNRVLPFYHYWPVNFNELVDGEGRDTNLTYQEILRKDEPPAKVCFVPKTQKTPRVIAVEPVYNQLCQQGLMRVLVHLLERDKRTKGQINFTDQTINQNLALSSSITREFATIDLKEASDRLHAAVVHLMLQSQPNVSRAAFACRSLYAKLPNGKVIPMKKFASQGSAVTFPLEAMAFYSIAVASFADRYSLPVRHPRVKSFAKKVFVYGDDIIVPTKEVDTVINGLELSGLLVNTGKTFSQSHFRESCGTDAFGGHVVTPIYIRTPSPRNKRDVSEIAAYVATANQAYEQGYWRTSDFLRETVEECMGFELPHVRQGSELLGWYSFQGHYSVHKWSDDLQCFLTRGLSLRIRKKTDRLEGYRALAKYFTESEANQYFPDGYHQVFPKTLDGWLCWAGVLKVTQLEDRWNTGEFMEDYEVVEKPRLGSFMDIRYPLDDERFAVTSRRGAVYTKLHWATA